MREVLDIDAIAAQSRITVTMATEPATSADEPDSRHTLMSGSVGGLLVAAAVAVLGSVNTTFRPVRNLLVIPVGPAPTSPADALSLDRVRQVLSLIGDRADIILVGRSPVLDSSETLLVAAEVDGVILVSRSDPGHPDALRLAATVLDPIGARIFGVVVNHQSRRRSMGGRDTALESGMAGSPMPGQHAINDDDDVILVDTSPAPFPLRVVRSLSRLRSTAS